MLSLHFYWIIIAYNYVKMYWILKIKKKERERERLEEVYKLFKKIMNTELKRVCVYKQNGLIT